MTDIPRYTAHPGYVTPARQGELCFYKDLEALRKRVEELERELDGASSIIQSYDHLLDNREGHIIADAQIDAAWKIVELYPNRHGPAEFAFSKVGIVRCEECDGNGYLPSNDPDDIPAGLKCQTCNGHRWVVKDEKLK